jgi:hypothetical protein
VDLLTRTTVFNCPAPSDNQNNWRVCECVAKKTVAILSVCTSIADKVDLESLSSLKQSLD